MKKIRRNTAIRIICSNAVTEKKLSADQSSRLKCICDKRRVPGSNLGADRVFFTCVTNLLSVPSKLSVIEKAG